MHTHEGLLSLILAACLAMTGCDSEQGFVHVIPLAGRYRVLETRGSTSSRGSPCHESVNHYPQIEFVLTRSDSVIITKPGPDINGGIAMWTFVGVYKVAGDSLTWDLLRGISESPTSPEWQDGSWPDGLVWHIDLPNLRYRRYGYCGVEQAMDAVRISY